MLEEEDEGEEAEAKRKEDERARSEAAADAAASGERISSWSCGQARGKADVQMGRPRERCWCWRRSSFVILGRRQLESRWEPRELGKDPTTTSISTKASRRVESKVKEMEGRPTFPQALLVRTSLSSRLSALARG